MLKAPSFSCVYCCSLKIFSFSAPDMNSFQSIVRYSRRTRHTLWKYGTTLPSVRADMISTTIIQGGVLQRDQSSIVHPYNWANRSSSSSIRQHSIKRSILDIQNPNLPRSGARQQSSIGGSCKGMDWWCMTLQQNRMIGCISNVITIALNKVWSIPFNVHENEGWPISCDKWSEMGAVGNRGEAAKFFDC